MDTAEILANDTVRLLTFIGNSIRPEGEIVQDNIVQALYNLHKLSPGHMVVTCPVMRRNYFYMSENWPSVFGHEDQYVADHFIDLKTFFSHVHPADLPGFGDCVNFYSSFIREQPPEDFLKFRVRLHYRFQKADGSYTYLREEKAMLVTNEKVVVHYSIIHTMPPESHFSGVKMEVYREGDLLKKITEYKPSDVKNRLSGREEDIVQLIRQGLTTKEIAAHLNISNNTVRNIKSRMFAKYKVNNTIELLNRTN